MQSENAPRVLLLAAFATVYVVWGSTYLAIRYALESLPPFSMMGLRAVIAGGLLYAWARLGGAPAPTRGHWREAIVLGGLLFLGGHGTLAWAEQRVPSGTASLLYATVPLWAVLLAWGASRGTRPGLAIVAGLLLGLVGVAFLVGPGHLGAGSPATELHGSPSASTVDPAGAAAILFGSLLWAAGTIRARRASQPASPILATALQLLAGGGLLLIAGILGGEAHTLRSQAVSWRSLAALAYLVVFGSLLAFTAYVWLLRVATPARVTTYAYVNPVIALLLGWMTGDEAPSAMTAIAALVILGGVVLVFSSRQPEFPSRKEENHDRTHLEGHHPRQPVGRVPRLPAADRSPELRGHAGEPRCVRPAAS